MSAAPRTLTAPSRQDAGALSTVVARLRRALRTGVRNDYAWERLPMAQVEILQRLVDEPGLRISQLAARHNLAINTVSNLIQQMVLAGLVERTPATDDRRAVAVSVTEHGARELASWLEANNRRLARAMEQLGAHDQRAIAQALPSLARLVQQLELHDGAAVDVRP